MAPKSQAGAPLSSGGWPCSPCPPGPEEGVGQSQLLAFLSGTSLVSKTCSTFNVYKRSSSACRETLF